MARAKTQGALALSQTEEVLSAITIGTSAKAEQIVDIPLAKLHAPEFHPFQVRDDLDMTRLTEKIKRDGVLLPGIARPRKDGGYELVVGNRRKLACERCGLSTMPVIVRELDNDAAIILMVDSNLETRSAIQPSEYAWAYRVELEALNHRGIVVDGIDIGTLSVTILAKRAKTSKSQIFRYIRMTELVPALMDMVDIKKIAFSPAVELSYLTRKEQAMLLDMMEKHETTPTLSQAQTLKRHSLEGTLTENIIEGILLEERKTPVKLIFSEERLQEYFAPTYTPEQMEAVIIKLLEGWHKKQQKA